MTAKTVWVVQSGYWDDADFVGVYESESSANYRADQERLVVKGIGYWVSVSEVLYFEEGSN